MFERQLALAALTLAAVVSAPVAPAVASPVANVDIVVIVDLQHQPTLAGKSRSDGRFSAKINLPRGAFAITTGFRTANCTAVWMTHLTVNGVPVRNSHGMLVDTEENPELRRITMTGRIETDPAPYRNLAIFQQDNKARCTSRGKGWPIFVDPKYDTYDVMTLDYISGHVVASPPDSGAGDHGDSDGGGAGGGTGGGNSGGSAGGGKP